MSRTARNRMNKNGKVITSAKTKAQQKVSKKNVKLSTN